LDDYYLWCDHRAKDEAARITEIAHEHRIPAIEWCGGVYSSEWGWAKLLHWLRTNPDKRARFVTMLEHCDMVAATLCGVTDATQIARSVCAMGHKWLWGTAWDGYPDETFFRAVDPLLAGMRDRMPGRYATSDTIAGTLSPAWAERLGMRAGIPIPTGAFDAHWDAIGAGVALGDVVNVLGTASCIMAISTSTTSVPGVCGVVPGSIHPARTGIEAGLSGLGALYEAVASRAGTSVRELSRGLETYRAGQTGLLRLTWDNGDRTILVNPNLGGVTLGLTLVSTAQDELFAAIEGTAMHTRIIFERMRAHDVPVERVIHGGGIPQKNDVVNQVFANVLNTPVLIPERPVTSLGAAIFAFMAAGTFATIEEAQAALCPSYRTIRPDPDAVQVYESLFPHYERLYVALGNPRSEAVAIGEILPHIRRVATEVRESASQHVEDRTVAVR
jgi:L-ribulokinase